MKRAILIGAVVSVTLCATATAQPDPMAGFYGNTVTVAVPAGYYFARRYIDPDGTWREPHGDGWIRGVWKLENGQVCSWQTEPPVQALRHYCYKPVPRKVGDTWTTIDPDSGNEVHQALEAGRK